MVTLPGRDSGPERPAVLLAAHTDTVFGPDTPLAVRRTETTLHGPGIGDNCLGVAAVLALPALLRAVDQQPAVDLLLTGNVGEEGLGNLRGIRAVVDAHPRIRAMAAVEGHNLGRVTHIAVGSRRLRVTATGPGGHSWGDFGKPSALHALARFVAELDAVPLPKVPKTTLNVGLIEGGVSVNTIAPSASCLIDLRSIEAEALHRLADRIDRTVLAANRNGVTVTSEVLGERPAGVVPLDSPVVRIATAALAELGIQACVRRFQHRRQHRDWTGHSGRVRRPHPRWPRPPRRRVHRDAAGGDRTGAARAARPRVGGRRRARGAAAGPGRSVAPWRVWGAPARTYVALDLEGTGMDPARHEIIEIAAVLCDRDRIIDRFSTLVRPRDRLSLDIAVLTGIDPGELDKAPSLGEVAPALRRFVAGRPLVGQSIAFDLQMLEAGGIVLSNAIYDTYDLATLLLPDLPAYNLATIAAELGIVPETSHRALSDAEITAQVFQGLLRRLERFDTSTLDQLAEYSRLGGWGLADLFATAAAARSDQALPLLPPRTSCRADRMSWRSSPPVTGRKPFAALVRPDRSTMRR